MSSISLAVGANSVCIYIVVALKQFVDLISLVSGNYGVYDYGVLLPKTSKICLRRRLASVCTLFLDHDVDCFERNSSSCLFAGCDTLLIKRRRNEQAV